MAVTAVAQGGQGEDSRVITEALNNPWCMLGGAVWPLLESLGYISVSGPVVEAAAQGDLCPQF